MSGIRTRTRKRLVRLRRRQRTELVGAPHERRLYVFRNDACLRIGGVGRRHAEITARTSLIATSSHLKGEPKRYGRGKLWDEDLWVLQSPLGEAASYEEHLNWLWEAIGPHKAYFDELISTASWADVCLGCLSESYFPVLTVRASSMSIVKELNVDLAFNFTCG